MIELKVIFENEELQKTKSEQLSKNYEGALALEEICVSKYSPGTVDNSENLARQIFSPIHLDKDNRINAAFFTDVFDKGLSTNRLMYSDPDKIHASGEKTVKRIQEERNQTRTYIGFVSANTGDIRAITEEGSHRVYCVYDSSLEQDSSHADVCMIRPENPPSMKDSKKSIKLERRRHLQEAFQKVPVTLAPTEK